MGQQASARILTNRLLLRQPVADDFAAFHALTADPEMRRFLTGAVSTEESFRRFLAAAGGWAVFGYGTFMVVDRATDALVGHCGLFRMERDMEPGFAGEPEAGWIIAHSAWGKGYAFEAMVAAVADFERRFGPQRTVCMIVPGNLASERIAARLGYYPIGLAAHKGEQVMRYARDPR